MPRATRFLSSLAAAGVLAAGAAVAGPVAAAQAYNGQPVIFQDDAQLLRDPVGTLATLKELGVDRIRVFVMWNSVAPSPGSRTKPRGFDAADPASYPTGGWGAYDVIDRTAASDGISVYFDVTGPAPRWAASGGPSGTDGVWMPSAHEYQSFVTAVGKRYDGSFGADLYGIALPRVSFWGIWNEPNYGVDLAPETVHGASVEVAPAVYRGLVNAAWNGLRSSGHSRDTILIGELAPRGQTAGGLPGTFGGMVPIRFLRALYCVNSRFRPLSGAFAAARGCPTNGAGARAFYRQNPGLFDATGFADHPYPQGGAPLVPTWPNGGENLYTDWSQLPALERFLDRVQHVYGRGKRLPIYNTEFGDQVPRVSQATAAYYLNWFEYLSWRDPRIATTDQYLLVNPPSGRFPTGLETSSGHPMASFYAFRLPLFMPVTRTRPHHSLEVWGDARPDKGPNRGAPVEIQFQPSGRGAFQTVATVAHVSGEGYFDTHYAFPGSGNVRLQWSYPDGTAIHSRVVAITVR